MYSLVLMTAMTAGPDVGFDPLFSRCGCAGSGYAGQGTAFGCIGHVPAARPGLFHSSAYSCCGCVGPVWTPPPVCGPVEWCPRTGQFGWVGASCLGTFPPGGCYGGCAGLISYWGPPSGLPLYTLYGTPWATVPEPPAMPPPAPKLKPPEVPPGEQGASATSATVRVVLPPGAALYVNGNLTKQTGADRSFVTPPLVRGARYSYDVRAEVLVNGKLEVEERQIVVIAGAEVKESFPNLVALVGRAGDRVTGK